MSYRLSWWDAPSPAAGLPLRRDPFRRWIEADDGEAIVSYVSTSGLAKDQTVLIERIFLDETIASVLTMSIEVELWDPGKHPMPRPSAGISPPRYPTTDRITFLRELRRVVNAAIRRKILNDEDGGKLLNFADRQTDFSK